MIANVCAARDPLSVEYDGFAATFVALLLSDPFGWHSARITSPPGDPVDAGGLTAHERAMQRAIYYAINSTGAEGPRGGRWVKNREWSIQSGGWAEPVALGNFLERLLRLGSRQRVGYYRAVRGFSASEAAAAKPPGELYILNPGRQSQAMQ